MNFTIYVRTMFIVHLILNVLHPIAIRGKVRIIFAKIKTP